MVSRCGLSSAGSALVESSKQPVMVSTQAVLWLKVATVRSFALNRGIVTDIMPATFLPWSQNGSAMHSTPSRLLSARLVHCYCLIITLYLHSQRWVKVKAPPKPLQAEHSSNSDIWLLA